MVEQNTEQQSDKIQDKGNETDQGNKADTEVVGNPNSEKAKLAMVVVVGAILFVMYFISNLEGSKNSGEKDKQKEANSANSLLEKAESVEDTTAVEAEEAVHFLQEEWFDEEFQLEEPTLPVAPSDEQDEFYSTDIPFYSGEDSGGKSPYSQQRRSDSRTEVTKNRQPLTVDVNDIDDGFDDFSEESQLSSERKQQESERRRRSIVFKSGESTNDDFFTFGDPRSRSSKKLGPTSFPQVKATQVGDMNRIIAQGKTIPVILESSINTNLPGTVRAIVARDTYSEIGKNILIEKGARVIGTYNAAIINGQARVAIVWNRLIMNNGVDINISSDTIDEIGRAGTPGELHTKWFSKILQATLISAVPVVMSNLIPKVSEVVTGNQAQPTATPSTPNPGSTPTPGSTGTQAQVVLPNITIGNTTPQGSNNRPVA